MWFFHKCFFYSIGKIIADSWWYFSLFQSACSQLFNNDPSVVMHWLFLVMKNRHYQALKLFTLDSVLLKLPCVLVLGTHNWGPVTAISVAPWGCLAVITAGKRMCWGQGCSWFCNKFSAWLEAIHHVKKRFWLFPSEHWHQLSYPYIIAALRLY